MALQARVYALSRVCARARRASSSFAQVDPAEQRKFAAAAPEWWDPQSTAGAGLLHALNPVRVRYVAERVAPHIVGAPPATPARPLAGLRAVDVGCGGGLLAESLARLGATVVGLDPTAEAVAAARAHAAGDPLTAGIDYRHGTVEALAAAEGGGFDLVCCLEVVEHVPDADAFVGHCARLVRPGGALVMSTLNRTRKAWLLAILGAEHLGRLLPVGTRPCGARPGCRVRL
jgi:2-polyprenyl-6-hydroxyphenyl methylase/3-demethylubiquinone-9 3-methyltransferase